MGDAQPRESDGEEKVLTLHMIVLRGLIPSLPMKKSTKPKSGYLDGIFGCYGASRAVPGMKDV